jgi:iron(III) transport system ATP-binding protein
MTRVTVQGLTRRFPGTPPALAVDALDLEVEEGEFLALLGPSGCGKTTTLRSVAGLERPDAGRITIGDTTVFDAGRRVDVPPDKRRIGMVFQSYALWPHLTVRRNLAYPLRAQGQRAALDSGRVEEVARVVECEGLLDRLPAQLSGGQQQRVALARALVADPALILFDEPLSNLDARLRDQMRSELHRIHRARPFTAVYVTHDQSEALALGQRIAIMRDGRIEQLGTPEDIFERPASEYVAAFIGMANRLVVRAGDTGPAVGGTALVGATERLPAGPVALRFGPHDARLVPGAQAVAADEVGLAVRVLDAEFGGRHRHVTVTAGPGTAALRLSLLRGDAGSFARRIAVGDELVMAFSPARVAAFPGEAPARSHPEPEPVGGVGGGPAWAS